MFVNFHQLHPFRSAWVLTAGLFFTTSAPGIYARATKSRGSKTKAVVPQRTSYDRFRDSSFDSSKLGDAANFSGQFANETLMSSLHSGGHQINQTLDIMAEQPCNVRESSKYTESESVDPACVMLFHSFRRIARSTVLGVSRQ